MKEYIPRIIQTTLAIPLIVLTALEWHNNHIGQNMLNILAIMIMLTGVDNLIILYRCYLDKQSIETEGSFVIFAVYMLAMLFEKFNRTDNEIWFNYLCRAIIMIVLGLNALYFLAIIITLMIYMVRHIYRLMTETLLSANTNMQRNELELILNSRKSYAEAKDEHPTINDSCSICLTDFVDTTVVVVLPGCQHCFHVECIEEWLSAKATCPYCRNNIRLNVI